MLYIRVYSECWITKWSYTRSLDGDKVAYYYYYNDHDV
jgi:hypothetical protein